MSDTFRFADLTPAEHRDAIAALNLMAMLQRLSSYFTYAVIGAMGALFLFHGLRTAAQIGGLS